MTRQIINTGTIANDGSGDTLRQAGNKINQNFAELYNLLGPDSNSLGGLIEFDSDGILFSSGVTFRTKLRKITPTANRFINLPNASGTLILDSDTQTLSNKTLISPIIRNLRLYDSGSNNYYTFVVGELDSNHNINIPILTDSADMVLTTSTQTMSNKTLDNPILIGAQVHQNLKDSADRVLLSLQSVTNSVNFIETVNSITSSGPILRSSGTDTNIDLNLSSKGTGAVNISSKTSKSYQNVVASGAISLTVPVSIFNSGSALAMTLANGTKIVEFKYFININSGTATITPSNLANGTTVTVAAGQSCTLAWTGSDWQVFSTYGATLA